MDKIDEENLAESILKPFMLQCFFSATKKDLCQPTTFIKKNCYWFRKILLFKKMGMLSERPCKINGINQLPSPPRSFSGQDVTFSPSSGPLDQPDPRLLDERECIKIVDFGLSNTFQVRVWSDFVEAGVPIGW